MAAYDSDSSGGADADYTETSVLLGYPSKEPTDDTFSQLGGHPTWLSDNITPSGSLATCKVCNGYLTLLLQLNGDLPGQFPGHERKLYLFSCRKKACRRKDGSVRAIRGSRVTGSKTANTQKQADPVAAPPSEVAPLSNIGGALFRGTAPSSASANPFSSPSSSNTNPFSASGNPFANASSLAAKPAQRPDSVASLPETFASKARISESSPPADSSFKPAITPRPHEPWPSLSDFPPPYPKSHLDADYETLSAPSTPQLPQVNPDMDTGMDGGGAEDNQLLESTMDKTFQKFADRLAQNPEQVLRYEFDGQPLLYSTTDAVGALLSPIAGHAGKITTITNGGSRLPRCTNCGAGRVFELQLTPHAITVLEEEEIGLDGMDWGTVILAVCSKDCAPSDTKEREGGYLEEWVGVQWEELEEKRRR